jgi:hypothetical protein
MKFGIQASARGLMLVLATSLAACGADDKLCGNGEDCESMMNQIRIRADGDVELTAEQRAHPCTDPPLKTSTTDYGPACTKYKDCVKASKCL